MNKWLSTITVICLVVFASLAVNAEEKITKSRSEYLPAKVKSTGASVVIFPGGAYC